MKEGWVNGGNGGGGRREGKSRRNNEKEEAKEGGRIERKGGREKRESKFYCDKHHDRATAWGVRAGTQDRNLEAGAEAETQEELDCFHLAQFAFEYNLGPSVHGWPYPLSCPTTTTSSIINQENAQQTCL